MFRFNFIARVAIFVATLLASVANAADIQVAATIAARNALTTLATDFEKQTGHRVVLRFGTTNAIRDELLAGRMFDLAVLSTRAIDELAEKGLVAPASKVNLFRSGVGISSPADSTISIRSTEELRGAVLASDKIALSMAGASGPVMRSVFNRLGIMDAVQAKLIPLDGQSTTEAVAAGKAQLGFTQVSEILEVPAARFVGPLPPDVQVYSNYGGGVAAKTASAEAAISFVELLRSAGGRAKLKALGLDPFD